MAEALYLPRLVQDGALDTAVLQDYYALLKRIYAVNEAYPIFNFPLIQFPADYVYHLGESGGSLYLGYARLAAASTGYGSPSYLTPAFTALVQNQPIVVRPFPTQAGALWQPHVLMAVNINSKNPQLALRFIRDMLSDEYQVGNPGYGDFPVTQSAVQLLTTQRLNHMFQLAYANLVEMYGENHAGIQWLKEPTIEIPFDLDALIRSFDTVYLPEPVIQDAVSSNLWLYISEELTLDEAVAACEQTVALYLAERQ